MDVDEALSRLGTVGRWQITYYTLLSVAVMFPACWHMLAFTFIGEEQVYHVSAESVHVVCQILG